MSKKANSQTEAPVTQVTAFKTWHLFLVVLYLYCYIMCNVTVIDHLHQCDIVFDIPVCFLSVYRLLPVYYSIGTNVYRH